MYRQAQEFDSLDDVAHSVSVKFHFATAGRIL